MLRRDGKSATGTDAIEIAANRFAAELLVPGEALAAMIGDKIIKIEDDRPIEALARKFKVSKKAMESSTSSFWMRLSSQRRRQAALIDAGAGGVALPGSESLSSCRRASG